MNDERATITSRDIDLVSLIMVFVGLGFCNLFKLGTEGKPLVERLPPQSPLLA